METNMSGLLDSLRQAATTDDSNLPQIGGAVGLIAAATVMIKEVLGWQRGSKQDALQAQQASRDQMSRWAEQLLTGALENQRATTQSLNEIEKQLASHGEMMRQVLDEIRSARGPVRPVHAGPAGGSGG